MKTRNLIALVITALFLFLAIYKIDIGDFTGAFRHLNPLYFIPALFVYFVCFFFRALRWRLILSDGRSMGIWSLYGYLIIGYMANNVLPARLGELVRAYVTGRREKVSRSAAFASVVLERLFDGLTIVFILIMLMFIAGIERQWLIYLSVVSSLIFVGGITFLFMLAFMRESTMKIAAKIFSLFPKKLEDLANHILGRFLTGLGMLHSAKDLLMVIAYSFAVWGCEALVYMIYLKAFNVDVPMHAALLTLVVVNLSMMIPSSPGGIGIFQFACIKALAVFGVSQGLAFAYSSALHATQLIPVIILGLILLPYMGFSFKEISHVDLDESASNDKSGT